MEIKVRMWSPGANKYFYDVSNVYECLKQQRAFDEITSPGDYQIGPISPSPWNHVGDGMVFELWTTKQDNEKTDLYAGDVVEYFDIASDSYIPPKRKIIGIIEFDKNRCALLPREIIKNHKGGRYWTPWDQCRDLKKIGTIHDPEFEGGI